ncbi:type III-B CRISPR module-associated protein Cmr5 [Anditalea andensis]|nr:type III-B CRISPR module-associated protein Cmr5 [Anditalea andensis]
MKLNEELIRTAIKAIEHEKIADENGQYKRQYNGYIASFGAAIIQSGLLPAVIFFENANANSEENKTKVINALVYVLKEHYKLAHIGLPFHSYLLQEGRNTPELLNEVNQAAAALKLALRTFKKMKDEKE